VGPLFSLAECVMVKSTCLVFRPGRQSSQVQLEQWANRQLGVGVIVIDSLFHEVSPDAEAGFELFRRAIWEALDPVDPCPGITLESTGKSLRSMGLVSIVSKLWISLSIASQKSSLWLPVRACLILGSGSQVLALRTWGYCPSRVHAVNQTGGWVCVESLG
jgi:hypothetical protein